MRGQPNAPPSALVSEPGATTPRSRSLSERLLDRPAARAALSVVLAFTLVLLATVNMPQSSLRTHLLDFGRPYLNALGLDQDWEVFAPDPRRASLAVRAKVRFADGRVRVWRPPHGGALLGPYWDYRWAKWLEPLTGGAAPELLRPAALYAARQEARPEARVTRVTLYADTFPLVPPGPRRAAPAPRRRVIYRLRLP